MYNAIHICGQTRLSDNRAHGCDGSVVVAAKLRNERLCVLVSDKANVFGLRSIRLGQDDVCRNRRGCFALPCQSVSQKGFSAGEGYRPEQVVFVAAPNAFQ